MNTSALYLLGIVALFGGGPLGPILGVILIAVAASLDAWPPE